MAVASLTIAIVAFSMFIAISTFFCSYQIFLLISIRFFNEAVLTEKTFKLSSLDTYQIPDDNQDVCQYLKSLPSGTDHPEAFGQHPNADINAQMVTGRSRKRR